MGWVSLRLTLHASQPRPDLGHWCGVRDVGDGMLEPGEWRAGLTGHPLGCTPAA
jgi:hypothetical protein